MHKFGLMAGICILLLSSTISATDCNGRFVITNTDSSKIAVLLQINTNTGNDALGGATIVVGFDTSSIFFKDSPVKNVDYIYHNFCGGNYSPATITRPMSNRVWINIDLPYNNSNNGTLVAGAENWTDVVTIYFDITDPEGMASLYWITTSPFWGIYDADNITLWSNGQFENQVNFPLPVELSSFTASLLDNNSVLLRWSVMSSLNNYGFEIEKSAGRGSELIWEKIGFVESAGNSITLMEYSFIDFTKHSSATVNYRLKIVDNDGSYSYSDVVEVYTGPMNYELAQNYPNPFNPSTKIVVRLPHTTNMKLVVYNMLGEAIRELANSEFDAGIYEFVFDAAGLASGIYVYRLESAGFTESRKMVLLR